jgi:hypothetical protein
VGVFSIGASYLIQFGHSELNYRLSDPKLASREAAVTRFREAMLGIPVDGGLQQIPMVRIGFDSSD